MATGRTSSTIHRRRSGSRARSVHQAVVTPMAPTGQPRWPTAPRCCAAGPGCAGGRAPGEISAQPALRASRASRTRGARRARATRAPPSTTSRSPARRRRRGRRVFGDSASVISVRPVATTTRSKQAGFLEECLALRPVPRSAGVEVGRAQLIERGQLAVGRHSGPDRVLPAVAVDQHLLTLFARQESQELLGRRLVLGRLEDGGSGDVLDVAGIPGSEISQLGVHARLAPSSSCSR